MSTNNMMYLRREGNDVYDINGKKMRILQQRTKNNGKGDPTVILDGTPNSNGKQYQSLKSLQQGDNWIEARAYDRTPSEKYILTSEEKKKIAEYQSKIDQIINKAKERYIEKPVIKDINKMTKKERLEYAAELEKFLSLVRG
ncbi:MAG: hypothetical protein GX241_07610 [Ruminococcaceae bacterium]|nr:hypothetical protein [Oscillospiraceae bacterium]